MKKQLVIIVLSVCTLGLQAMERKIYVPPLSQEDLAEPLIKITLPDGSIKEVPKVVWIRLKGGGNQDLGWVHSPISSEKLNNLTQHYKIIKIVSLYNTLHQQINPSEPQTFIWDKKQKKAILKTKE